MEFKYIINKILIYYINLILKAIVDFKLIN
jgi:hypothetical protein